MNFITHRFPCVDFSKHHQNEDTEQFYDPPKVPHAIPL